MKVYRKSNWLVTVDAEIRIAGHEAKKLDWNFNFMVSSRPKWIEIWKMAEKLLREEFSPDHEAKVVKINLYTTEG